MPSKKHLEILEEEFERRARAYNILTPLLIKYGLTKTRKLNKFFGIKNGKALLEGDLSEFDHDTLAGLTGQVIGQHLKENIDD